MSLKIEEKLLEMEDSTLIRTDEELIKKIELIITEEELHPVEERDFELIDEAVNIILSLRNIDVDELNECADNVIDRLVEKNRMEDKVVAKSSND